MVGQVCPQLPGFLHSCRAPARVHALPSLPPIHGCKCPCVLCVHTVSECVRCALHTSLSLFLLSPTARQFTTKLEWEASRVPPSQVTPDELIPWKARLAAAVWQHKLIPVSDSGKVSGHFRDKIGTFLLLAWVEVKCHGLTSA